MILIVDRFVFSESLGNTRIQNINCPELESSTTMAFINFHPWITALFFAITWCHVAGETCPVYGYSSGFYYLSGYKSCTNGCCGRYPNYYCCTFSTAALAGIVLGCILAVCGMIFLCLYCVKKKKQPGRVVRPVHPTTNTIVFTGTSGSYPGMGYPNQPYGGVPQPPPYKRLASPPPEYGAPLRVNPYQGNNSYNGARGGGGGYGYGQAWNNNAAQPSTADAPPPAYAASAAYPMSSAPSAAPAYTASAAPSTASAAPRVAAVPPASTSAAAAPLGTTVTVRTTDGPIRQTCHCRLLRLRAHLQVLPVVIHQGQLRSATINITSTGGATGGQTPPPLHPLPQPLPRGQVQGWGQQHQQPTTEIAPPSFQVCRLFATNPENSKQLAYQIMHRIQQNNYLKSLHFNCCFVFVGHDFLCEKMCEETFKYD